MQGEVSPSAQRPRGAQQVSLDGEKGAVPEALLAAWGWGLQPLGLVWSLGAVAVVPISPASQFSCLSASEQAFGF